MKTAIPNEREESRISKAQVAELEILRCELGASVVIIDYFSSYSSSASQRGSSPRPGVSVRVTHP